MAGTAEDGQDEIRLRRRHTHAAWGGILGPAAFVSAWLAGGAMRRGYSPVADGVSRLAAVGASTRPLMTAGFVGFGVGLPVYAVALRGALPGPAWQTAVGTGLATLGVGAFPVGASSSTLVVHRGCAVIAYLTLAATPLLAARPLAGSGRRWAARASVAAGVAAGLCLAGAVLSPGSLQRRVGLLQRVGLTLGDAWLVASAAWILSGGVVAGPREGGCARADADDK